MDGDEKGQAERLRELPILFLPGVDSPEEVLKEVFASADHEQVASFLGVGPNQLNAAMEAAVGEDHHDYFQTLAGILGKELDSFLTLLFEWWTQHETGIGEANALNAAIAEKVFET